MWSVIIHRHAILLVSLKALGAIRAALFAAGLAALVATIASWATNLAGGVRPAWATSLQTFGLEITLAFLPAAIVAWLLMPPAADLTRPIRPDERTAMPPVLSLLLVALAVVALLQAPAVAAWWSEDRALLTQALGTARDPMGLDIIPKVMLLSLPAMAAVALLAFVLTSSLGLLVRRDLALQALGAAVAVQAGLVIGLHLVLRAIRSLGATIQDLIAEASDPKASAQVAEFILRHDAAGMDVSWRLVWILGGFVLVLATSVLVRPR